MASVARAPGTPSEHSRPSILVFCVLAALVLLAYIPALSQPLLEDDYPNIVQAKLYGPAAGWSAMFHDPLFRVRATSWLLLNGVYRLFGMHAAAYYAAAILLHIINTWMVYALGSWRPLGYELTAWAAAFFAVYEGHQEAVMWVSAVSEPLMLLFGLLSLLGWIHFLQSASGATRSRLLFYAASVLAFCLALLSKESAVIFVPLFALTLAFDVGSARAGSWLRPIARKAVWLIPFGALACLTAFSIADTRTYSFRFQDGSFSLHAPFWLIWPDNFARMLRFWGLLALVGLSIWRPRFYRRILAIGGSWMAIGLIPYSFLTYSIHIPSRQLYLASVGLSIIVGFALLTLHRRYSARHRVVVIAVSVVMLSANVIYLWTKKRGQYLERAAPTEQLIDLARQTKGPIYVRCFPRPPIVAESAVQLIAGRLASDLVWDSAEASNRHAAATFCYTAR